VQFQLKVLENLKKLICTISIKYTRKTLKNKSVRFQLEKASCVGFQQQKIFL
jgi:hypothetical protein